MPKSLEELVFDVATDESEIARRITRLGRRSAARGRDGQLPEAYAKSVSEKDLANISAALRAGDWSFISYRERLLPKSYDVPPRRLSVAAAKDRAPLQIMNSSLLFEAPQSRRESPNRVMKRLVESAQSSGFDHVVRLDLRNFYPSVQHDAVEQELERHITVDALRRLLSRALRTPTIADHAPSRVETGSRGIPQGLAISNSLAELVMEEFDGSWRDDDSVRYFRYADDMLFLTRRDRHQQLHRKVRASLKLTGVEPHPFTSGGKSQWGRLRDGVEFLGYRVSPGAVSVRASGVHRLKRSIALSFARYSKEIASPELRVQHLAHARLAWFLNLRITGCVIDKESRGWVQYYALLTDIGILRDLDHFVSVLASKHGLRESLGQKSFVRTYRKWAKRAIDATGYIPNFDSYKFDDKREVLSSIFGMSEQRMNENGSVWVDREFARRTRLHVHTLERDLTPNYGR
ncbi:reverse transcriptase domain-containing protein [Microbacterium sp. NPDC089696]|uniref:reverse transcriptase domain-containing protein n=1 Tax=Microbacterium sp. NPDC089696 TaxID=3364199 RepID=UPI003803CBF0